jgi:hypothetical protein
MGKEEAGRDFALQATSVPPLDRVRARPAAKFFLSGETPGQIRVSPCDPVSQSFLIE